MDKKKRKTCEQCMHFLLHYILDSDGRYLPLCSGHCVYPRCKSRSKDSPICSNLWKKEIKNKFDRRGTKQSLPIYIKTE